MLRWLCFHSGLEERKQFPRRTAHNNVCGLCWVTMSRCLERNMAAELFEYNFWVLWAPQTLCRIVPIYPRKRQTTHTKTIYRRWINVMMYQPLFHHFSPSLPTYWNLLSLMLNNTWMQHGQNLITVSWISGYHQWVSGSSSLINMFVSCVLLLPSSYPPSGIIKDSSNTLNLIYLSVQAVLIMFSCFLYWRIPFATVRCQRLPGTK